MNLASLGYFAGWRLVRALPEPVAQGLFRTAADLAVRRGGKGIDRLAGNLDRVAPGADLTQQAVRSYARYWCEVFRLPATSRERIIAATETVDEHLLRDSVAGPKGTLMVLPHTGNWDAAGAWCGVTGVPFTTVAERLQPESLYEQFLAFRQSLGMEVLPLGPGTYDVLEQRLAAGGTVCLLADRDLTANGLDVRFFGATARMPAGPARLALATDANLLPTTLSFTDRGWRIRFHPYVEHTDLLTMTQAVADAFADAIADHPADWHMLQRLWLEDLEPAR
jgi:KDO2-lipid IV(A) lauroyltransferase